MLTNGDVCLDHLYKNQRSGAEMISITESEMYLEKVQSGNIDCGLLHVFSATAKKKSKKNTFKFPNHFMSYF